MIENASTIGWASDQEYLVSSEDLQSLQELRQKDEQIGSFVESKYGKYYLPTNLLIKIFRRLKFEVVRIGTILFSRLFKRFSRFWRKAVSNKLIYKGSDRIETDGTQLEIVELSASPEELCKRLSTTQATHWILVKPNAQLLKSGVKFLLEASKAPNKLLHYGDSATPIGLIDRRPKHSKLLQRQIDISGPVIMSSTSLLRKVVSKSISTELWPLELFLNAKEDEINQVPEVLSLGNFFDIFNIENRQQYIVLVLRNLENSSVSAHVSLGKFNQRIVSYENTKKGKVSIVIPTRGTRVEGKALIVNAVKTIMEKTLYQDFEILVVADQDTPQEVILELEMIAGERLLLVRWKDSFNFSKKMNLGSVVSRGEYLLFLNDDVELVSPRWIDEMVGLLEIDGIGYVGALLFFQDGTIQHAGHFYESGAGHIAFKQTFKPQDPRQLYAYDRKVSGITAACALVPKRIFLEAGGFSEIFPGNYNDVDFALKVNELGYDSAVASNARLYHFESKSRDATVKRPELLALHRRWYAKIQKDTWFRGL